MGQQQASLARLHEAPRDSLLLLVGPPGAGKSAFLHQVVLGSLALDRPVIYVTTERRADQVVGLLRERGLGETAPAALSFVDAFAQTVGLSTPERADTLRANCMDLNSITIGVTRLQERIPRGRLLLAFDSLTSPYLLSGTDMPRFMRLFLSRFAAEGNSVVALIDEGCGKPEDLVAMMSVANGVIKMERDDGKQFLNVLKHVDLAATRIEVPIEPKPTIESAFDTFRSMIRADPTVMKQWMQSMGGPDEAAVRKDVGDFVNLFWPCLARWSSMLWDPKGFPTMIYEVNKQDGAFAMSDEMRRFFPWRLRLMLTLLPSLQSLRLMPDNFSKVEDMKRLGGGPWDKGALWERSGTIEYLEDASSTDQHYFRVHESSDCWGLENVGATLASHLPPHMAGQLKAFERDGRDWNAVETKCIGLGHPYCEFRLVPGEVPDLKASLQKDVSAVERIHERLMDRLMEFLLDGKRLVERPGFGSDVHLHPVIHAFGFPYLAVGGERYRMALRMGGARAGKKAGGRLMEAGLGEDEAVKRVVDFMNHCKVGRVAVDETIRIAENCESLIGLFTTTEEPSCSFTTGFLNGLFSAVKGQHVREVKCLAAGDPYCEWEIV